MNTASMAREPFSFFWIPAEIRCLVYQRLLCAPAEVINTTCDDPVHHATSIYQIFSVPAVLSTTKRFKSSTATTSFASRFSAMRNMSTWATTCVPTGHPRGNGLSGCSNPSASDSDTWFLCTPIGKTSLLPQLSQVKKPRGVLKVTFMKTWDMVDNINHKPTFLTNAVFQALRLMLSFKKVDIVLPQASGGEIAWPPSLTRKLETMLGPNLSMTELGLSSSRARYQEIGSAIPCPR